MSSWSSGPQQLLFLLACAPVGGLHRFPTERKVVSRAGAKKETESGQRYGGRAAFHLGVMPSIIRKRYNMTGGDIGLLPNNSQACAQVTGGARTGQRLVGPGNSSHGYFSETLLLLWSQGSCGAPQQLVS